MMYLMFFLGFFFIFLGMGYLVNDLFLHFGTMHISVNLVHSKIFLFLVIGIMAAMVAHFFALLFVKKVYV